MGIYYTANTIIGYKILITATPREEKYRGCSHDIEPNDKFCSFCGARAYFTHTVSDDSEELIHMTLMENCPSKFCVERDYDNNVFYFGIGKSIEHGEIAFMDIQDHNDIKKKVDEYLDEAGILDYITLDKFGIWLTNLGR